MIRPIKFKSSFFAFLAGVFVGCFLTATFTALLQVSEGMVGEHLRKEVIVEMHVESKPVEDADDFEGDGQFLSLIPDEDKADIFNVTDVVVEERVDITDNNPIGDSPVLWEDVDDRYKVSEARILRQKRLWKEGRADKPLFFFYQPSGGWGNQRYELMWAIIAANAMNRTLILPPIAPHSNMWRGFNKWKSSDLLPMARVLNMEALERVVDRGVLSFNDTTNSLGRYLPNLKILTYRRPEDAGWWSYQKIRGDWLAPEYRQYDVIFWEKDSMWCCCGATGPFKNYYSWHVMFNDHIKRFARRLIRDAVFDPLNNPNATFNAVHVRRGDHVVSDRRNPLRYWRDHDLGKFDRRLPLYIATDETDYSWFDVWESKEALKRFSRKIFWKDLRQVWIEQELLYYPKAMHGDVLGFIEIMICAYAKKWEGSKGSTFSQAILRTRVRRELRVIKFDWPPRPPGSP